MRYGKTDNDDKLFAGGDTTAIGEMNQLLVF